MVSVDRYWSETVHCPNAELHFTLHRMYSNSALLNTTEISAPECTLDGQCIHHCNVIFCATVSKFTIANLIILAIQIDFTLTHTRFGQNRTLNYTTSSNVFSPCDFTFKLLALFESEFTDHLSTETPAIL